MDQPRVEQDFGHLEPVASDLDLRAVRELVRHRRDVGVLLLVEDVLARPANGLLEVRNNLLHTPSVVALGGGALVIVQVLHVEGSLVLLGLRPLEGVPGPHVDALGGARKQDTGRLVD